MKFLVLWGKEKCGKTTTLNHLAGLLSNNFTQIIDSKNKTIALPVNVECDNRYIVDYKGKKIGITTHGDNETLLNEDITALNGCDLCICAGRTKGETVRFIEKWAKEDEIFWLAKMSFSCEISGNYTSDKFVIRQREILNKQQAKTMLEIVNGLIEASII